MIVDIVSYPKKSFWSNCRKLLDGEVDFTIYFSKPYHQKWIVDAGVFLYEGGRESGFLRVLKVILFMPNFATVHYSALGEGYVCNVKISGGDFNIEYRKINCNSPISQSSLK